MEISKTTLQRVFVGREVVVGFVLLAVIYGVSRSGSAIYSLYIGYWMFRPNMTFSATGLVVVWGWWALYTYLLAIVFAGAYRGLRRTVGAAAQRNNDPS